MFRIIARNIASNWIGYAVNAVVIFFLTPFVLHSLGDTRYGVWILANGLTGYFGLLDLGLRGGATQYLTRHLAHRDYHALNQTASTSVAALAACGVAVLFASALMSWLSPLIFTVPNGVIAEVRWCIVIIGASVAVGFAFAPFSAVFTATQRYDLANAVEIPLRLAVAAGTYIALQRGCDLLGLCAVNAVGNILGCLVRVVVAHRILPQLRLAFRLVAWGAFRPILSYGALNSLVQGAAIVKDYTSCLIIGIFMPVAALAPFNLAAGLVMQFQQFFAPMGAVFFPLATQLDAQGDVAALRRIYFSGSRLLACAATAVAMIGAVWASDFYRLWVGSQFVDGNEYTSVVVLFWILIAAGTINTGQRIGLNILFGCRAMRTLAVLTLGEALGGVVLAIPLIITFGLLGVALATLIPVIVVRGVMYPIAVCRSIHARPIDFARAAYVRPCLLAGVLAVPLLFLHNALPVDESWATLVCCGMLAGVLTAPIFLVVAIDPEERQKLVMGPLRRAYLRRNRPGAVK